MTLARERRDPDDETPEGDTPAFRAERVKVGLSTLSQGVNARTGLLTWMAQTGRHMAPAAPDLDLHFLTSKETGDYFREHVPGAQTDIVGWDNSRRALRMITEHVLLGPHLARGAYDALIMANAGTRPLVLPGKVALVQCIYGFHHTGEKELPAFTKLYRHALYGTTVRRADRIVVNSEYSRRLLLALSPGAANKAVVIPHGVDAAHFHDAPLSPQDMKALAEAGIATPYVAFVSMLYPYKNVHVAVEGFCRFVARTGAPHTLVLVGRQDPRWSTGGNYIEQLKAIATGHGLAGRLVFRDHLSISTLRAFYAAADVYLQPSLSETFGRTCIEAMACGTPIVAANAAATPEVVADAGLYFEGADSDGLSVQLERFCMAPELRDRFRARGLERARMFSVENEAAAIAAAVRHAVRSRRGR